jgi:hypothetical protein
MADLSGLDCVPVAIRDDPRYVGDHVIRHYRSRHIEDLLRDLGEPIDDARTLTIHGGIGTLTMTWAGNHFASAIPDAPAIDPRPPLTAPQITARRAVCLNCPMLDPDADRCRMCGCAGQLAQRTGSPWASCPQGKWP